MANIASTIVGSIEAGSAIVNSEDGSLRNTDRNAQLAAIAAGLGAPSSSAAGIAAIHAGNAALATATGVLASDIKKYREAKDEASKNDAKLDIYLGVMTMIGNSLIIASGFASATNTPLGKTASLALTALGDVISLSGVGIKNYSNIKKSYPKV